VAHAADNATPASPHSGDYTVCQYCAAWLVFDHDLQVRLITDQELRDLDPATVARLCSLLDGLTLTLPIA
jgi:hypothetical protein